MRRLIFMLPRAFGCALALSLAGLPLHAQPAPQNVQTLSYNAFTPTGWATITPSASSSRVPLGSTATTNMAFVAWVQNVGNFPANVTLGSSSVVASLTSGVYVAAGQCVALNALGATNIAAISTSGTTLNVMTGTGIPGACASSSGGGGGGGSSTIVSPLGGSTIAAASVAVVFGSGATLPSFAAPPTVNIGTAPTIAVTGTFWQATQPVSAASLPLPTGAASASNQTSVQANPGTSAASATAVQGVTGALAVKTDSSAVTQPVSATALPLPTGAASAANQTNASQKTQIVDGTGAVIAATSNNLNVQCANCSGSGVSTGDEASFTAGVSLFAGGGGFFQTTATSNALTTGQQGLFQMTANRALFTNLRNASGTEIGTSAVPLQVSMANTGANATAVKVDGSSVTQPVSGAFFQATQPISGTVTANAGTNLNTSALALDATLTGGTQKTKLVDTGGTNVASVSAAGAVKVDGSAATQPVSAVSLPLPTGAATAAKQPALGTAGSASVDVITVQGIASMTAVKVDGSAVTQPVSGTVTANAGTNLNTSALALDATLTGGTQKTKLVDTGGTNVATVSAAGAVKVDGSAATQPVSGTVTANAGTNLNTSALALDATLTGGTAKTKLVDTGGTNVASISAGGAVKVDNSAVTQPVSATSLPLPTGAATLAKQPALGVAGTAASDVITVQGITSMTALKVDGSGVTQPVSLAGTQSTNVAQVAGTNTDTNSGNKSAGTLRVVLATDQPALTNKLLVTPDANSAVNVAQINGVTPLMGNGTTGTGSQRVTLSSDNSAVAGLGAGATGSAPPTNAVYIGGNASGATGGQLKGIVTCDKSATYDASTNGKTTLVAGVASQKIYICGYQIGTGATATNVSIGDGTGAACVTTYTAITPAYQLAANDRTGMNSPFWNGLSTISTGDNLCVSTSAGNAVQVTLFYTIF